MPGRKALVKSDVEYEIVLIDATETPLSYLKKAKMLLFWKKKKRTLKTQLIVDKNGYRIKSFLFPDNVYGHSII